MENNNIWEYKFKVRSFDVDKNKSITLTSISEYLQEVAGDHANSMGFGYRQLVLQDMVWILSGIKIEVERFPLWEEEIRIETWIVGNDKFLSRRDFEWYDSKGNLIIKASTNWILFNTATRRPQLVERMEFPVEMYPNKVATTSPISNIRSKFDDDNPYEYKVRYTDLDMIGHMNNTKYIQLLMNYYGEEFQKTKKFYSIDINFKTEAKLNDALLLNSNTIDKNTTYHELKKAADSKVNCLYIVICK